MLESHTIRRTCSTVLYVVIGGSHLSWLKLFRTSNFRACCQDFIFFLDVKNVPGHPLKDYLLKQCLSEDKEVVVETLSFFNK